MTGPALTAIAVAIEVPHGPIVETLLERGFQVYAVNPKQLDRFRRSLHRGGQRRTPNVAAEGHRGIQSEIGHQLVRWAKW
jgi:hypothetical protein